VKGASVFGRNSNIEGFVSGGILSWTMPPLTGLRFVGLIFLQRWRAYGAARIDNGDGLGILAVFAEESHFGSPGVMFRECSRLAVQSTSFR
jgi:hypothetical protein